MGITTRIRQRWQIARWVGLALAVGLLSYWLASGLLARLELAASDLLFRLRGPAEQESPVVIVAIDDASFTQSDLQWPWPRDYIARIVSGIAAGRPKAIALDVFFYEPTTPEADGALAQAIKAAGNVVLVNDITTQSQGGIEITQLNRPIPELEAAAASLGLTNFPRDPDGVVRRLLAFQSHNDQLYYSWALQLTRLYLGESDFNVISAQQVDVGDRRIDLDGQYLLVNYLGPAGAIPRYSAYQVVDGLVDPHVFEGKIVLIGTTSESLHDSYPTPFGTEPPMPGVEINAHALDTILSQRYLHPIGSLWRLLLAMLGAGVGVALAVRVKPRAGLVLMVVVIVVYVILCVAVFDLARASLPMIGPLLGIGLTYLAGTSIQLYEEQRKRAQVRSLFERYVTPAAIDQMLDQPETYAAGGQRRELTVLFSDIRGFTSMSEKLSPDDVVAILNEYLSAMTEVIFRHEGTIDKFEGDAILAIWNAPLPVEEHPTKAVRCAMDMIERLEELQTLWSEKGRAALRIGVGLNTGQAFVGNIGSARRMDYTVIGDTVNLASRLQDLTKEEGIPILFSEATRDALSPEIKTRFVTTAQVKGRVQAVNVYTIDEGAA